MNFRQFRVHKLINLHSPGLRNGSSEISPFLDIFVIAFSFQIAWLIIMLYETKQIFGQFISGLVAVT